MSAAAAEFARRVAETEAMFREAVEADGAVMSADGRVSEAVAARLLGFSVKKLQRHRYSGELRGYLSGVGGGRVSYRLRHLATFVEASADSDLDASPEDIQAALDRGDATSSAA